MPAIRRSPRVLSTPGIVMLSPSRFTLTMLVSLQPGGGAALAAFRQASGPLLARHDVRIERVIRIHGKGQIVGAVVGAVVGGMAGAAVEEGVTRKTGLEITVRLDNGQLTAIVQEGDEAFHPGERVRLLSGSGGTRVTH
jgi:hypothetical protein